MHRLPPLNTLHVFETAARLRSFAAAADELNLTAAAVSHRIKKLEQELDIPLFIRQARGVRLTEAGQRYHLQVTRILVHVEQATAELQQTGIDGPLTVSAPYSFVQAWLIPRMTTLMNRFPGLQLTISAENRLVDLRDGTTDISIRFGSGDYPDLHCEYLMGDAINILICKDLISNTPGENAAMLMQRHPLLEDVGALTTEPWSSWRPWLNEAGVGNMNVPERVRFSDSLLALKACRESVGLCIGRLSIAFSQVESQHLQALMPWRRTEFSYFLVTHPAASDNPRYLAFRNWLVETVAEYQQSQALIPQPF